MPVQVHLPDATYELFRAHFGRPPRADRAGRPVAATVGLIENVLAILREPGVTHLACATDHVIESWRNDRFPGYKTGAGIDPDLLSQFQRAEDALRATGVVTWAMVEYEADDAIGTAAARWGDDPEVERIVVMSPDKDMTQLVREDGRVVTVDRRKALTFDAEAVRVKFGVSPPSIPDYLALVGDSADGFPGLPGWGSRSAAAVLTRYEHLEQIPERASQWDVTVRGAPALAATLRDQREDAFLYRELATLSKDVPLAESLDDLRWRGVDTDAFRAMVDELGMEELRFRVPRVTDLR